MSLVITLIFMAGCIDDLRNRNVFDSGAGDAFIRFSVENVVSTRDGDIQDMESVVDHAYLLFYEEDVSLETGLPIAAVRAEIDAASPGTLKFKIPLLLNPDTDYQLLAVGNADDYIPNGFSSYEEYIEAWCRNSSDSEFSPLQLFCDRIISPIDCLPMSGGVAGNSCFRFSMENGAYKVSASLSFRRMVARIDVANIVKEGFKVEGILLCNWRDAVATSSPDASIGNRLGEVHGVLSEENATDDMFITMPEFDEDGIQRLNKMIYCFPSVSYDSFLSDKESTALIIKAKYGSDTQSSYYRVNVGLNGNVSNVKANTKYFITIQSVKGSGASTPEEAYAASESPIVLSVVEDWDLDGSNFAMDENGNFIVVSSSRLNFDGDDDGNREVKVLTSKGLSWNASYIPDDDNSSEAFKVIKLSESSIAVSPVAENTESYVISGKCEISGMSSEGSQLKVEIALSQHPMAEQPYVPVIPDLPFAILPLDGERVKITHDASEGTIEIDAFDPDCFNSFIDIPFLVYIKSDNSKENLSISSELKWPLEGAVSKHKYNDYFYCSNSFSTSSGKISVFSKSKDKELTINDMNYAQSANNVKNNDTIYLSVGAMAPDDPPIKRNIRLFNNENWHEINYTLTIKPRATIIDDVIISDTKGQRWLIFDRNVQDLSYSNFSEYIGIKSDGSKYQAYNYLSQSPALTIPFKDRNNQGESFSESLHVLYRGVYKNLSNAIVSENSTSVSSSRYLWLQKFERNSGQYCISPFYDNSIYEKWNFPTIDILKLCAGKIRVSKLRMYLVSEEPVKEGKNKIPVCCYWPYNGDPMDNVSLSAGMTYGYFAAGESNNPESLVFIYCDKTEIKTVESRKGTYYGFSRLVRPLTSKELDDYKMNYLGYSSEPHKLTICHPDTYTSEGWLPY